MKIGYRLIGTAQAYANDCGVRDGILTHGVDRKEIFVTTMQVAGIKPYKTSVASIDSSLQAMGLDNIDMTVIHSSRP